MAAYPTLQFSGYEWAIKAGDLLGPGPNNFSASTDNVWVDDEDRLHLKITHRDGTWYCAEVYRMESLGYGTYTFYLSSYVDLLDKNVVGSPFLYQDDEHELDIEFSRWGVEEGPNAQFVVQPWDVPGHREQFDLSLTGDVPPTPSDGNPARCPSRAHKGTIPIRPQSRSYTSGRIPGTMCPQKPMNSSISTCGCSKDNPHPTVRKRRW